MAHVGRSTHASPPHRPPAGPHAGPAPTAAHRAGGHQHRGPRRDAGLAGLAGPLGRYPATRSLSHTVSTSTHGHVAHRPWHHEQTGPGGPHEPDPRNAVVLLTGLAPVPHARAASPLVFPAAALAAHQLVSACAPARSARCGSAPRPGAT